MVNICNVKNKYNLSFIYPFNESPRVERKIVKIVKMSKAYSWNCRLCFEEKLNIITFPEPDRRYNKTEIINKCRHTNKSLLS